MRREYWFASIAALGVLDWWCANVRHEGTLSQAGRETFRTDTVVGRAVWVIAWTALSAWLIPHIWRWPKQIIDEIS